ncbi:MAG TPA: hypothetical protein VN649_13635 [Ramlibacter sp.]|nr:hypothetical protein [Ramlibacter sp.]
MPRGLLYVFVFALPALLVSGIAAFALFGAAAGAMWLFAFGDNPWPQAAQDALGLGFAAAWLALWLALLAFAFVFGRNRATQGALLRRDLLAAAGVTALAIGAIALQQRSVGNLGPPSEGEACATFCRQKGFNGSSMPPRNAGAPTCSCIDAQGREVITVPIAEAMRAGGR